MNQWDIRSDEKQSAADHANYWGIAIIAYVFVVFVFNFGYEMVFANSYNESTSIANVWNQYWADRHGILPLKNSKSLLPRLSGKTPCQEPPCFTRGFVTRCVACLVAEAPSFTRTCRSVRGRESKKARDNRSRFRHAKIRPNFTSRHSLGWAFDGASAELQKRGSVEKTTTGVIRARKSAL